MHLVLTLFEFINTRTQIYTDSTWELAAFGWNDTKTNHHSKLNSNSRKKNNKTIGILRLFFGLILTQNKPVFVFLVDFFSKPMLSLSVVIGNWIERSKNNDKKNDVLVVHFEF